MMNGVIGISAVPPEPRRLVVFCPNENWGWARLAPGRLNVPLGRPNNVMLRKHLAGDLSHHSGNCGQYGIFVPATSWSGETQKASWHVRAQRLSYSIAWRNVTGHTAFSDHHWGSTRS
jgi:hypothetical protein